MHKWEMNYTLGLPLVLLLLIVSGCRGERFDTIRNVGSAGETIICFGDSLTEGVGAEPGEEYPTILSRLLGMRVLNAAIVAIRPRERWNESNLRW